MQTTGVQRSFSELHHHPLHVTRILSYLSVIFFIAMADAVMAYLSPIFVEEAVGQSFLMGLVISTSSMVGFVCDYLFARKFRHKSHLFFLRLTLIVFLVFPGAYIFFPNQVPAILVAMASWGVYYELIQFSNFHFVKQAVRPQLHAVAWGVLETFRGAAYLAGPLLAVLLLEWHHRLPLFGAIGLWGVSLGMFLVFQHLVTRHPHHHHVLPSTDRYTTATSLWNGLQHELSVWKTLLAKVWPLYLFTCALTMVDATFWTTGVLLSEQMRMQHPIGAFILPLYMLPSLGFGLLAQKFSRPWGKKRAGLIAGAIAGMGFIASGFMPSVIGFVLMIMAASLGYAIASPEITAVYEDFVARLGQFGNDMVGLQRSSFNLAYILGPITAGWLGGIIGYQKVFVVMGGILLATATLALLVLPRKVHMPQEELAQLDG